jgi:Protein of unknown function (DUF2568)
VNPLAAVSLAVRFLVAEVGALVALAVWAFDALDGVAAVLVAVALIAVVVGLWAALVAPKASRRLADPWRFVLELVIFAAATAALAAAGHTAVAIAYAAAAVISAALVRVWSEPAA